MDFSYNFFSGSGQVQMSSVRKHSGSTDHQTACAYLDKRIITQNDKSSDEETSISSISKEDRILFNTVYTVAKEELPSEKVNSILKLQTMNGLDVKYKNLSWDSIDGIQKSISKILTSELVLDLKMSPAYAIMLDESTDISITKHLSVCVRYEKNGKAVTKFLFNSCIRDGKSYTIVNCIPEEFQKLGIPLSKCTSIATDGAAVMTGKKTGVGVQLKSKYCPFATATHCVAHRLNLACSDSIKKDEYLTKFKTQFNSLYIFMSSSSIRHTTLHEIQQVLDEPNITVKEPHSVRWMGLRNAVSAVFTCYGSVLATLSQFAAEKNPVAKNLFKYFNNYKTAMMTAFMLDIHTELAVLSCEFQKENLLFSEVQAQIDGTINKLESLSAVDGQSVREMKERIQIDEENHVAMYNNNDSLEYKQTMIKEFENIKIKYIEKLSKNIKSRLHKNDEDVLSNLSKVLEPQTVCDITREERAAAVASLGQFYGYEKEVVVIEGNIDNLVENRTIIPALLDPEKLESEWPRLEGMILGTYSGMSTAHLCKKIILQHSATLPHFTILSSVALVMCVSSVDCERSFSTQNRLKVKYRSSMSPEKLDLLLKISMLGPDPEHYNPEPAVRKWLREKRRRKKRLCDEYKPRKKSKTSVTVTIVFIKQSLYL